MGIYTKDRVRGVSERATNKAIEGVNETAVRPNKDTDKVGGGLHHFYERRRIMETTIVEGPDYAEAHYNLGVALKAKGFFDEWIEGFRETMIMPAHYNLGIAFDAKGL